MKIKALFFLRFSFYCALLTPFLAQAQCCNETPWYLTLGGGFVFASRTLNNLNNSSTHFFATTGSPSGFAVSTLQNVNWQINFKDGYSGNVAIGKTWGEWEAELEFLYENIEVALGGQYTLNQQDALSLAVLGYQANNLLSTTSTRAKIGALFVNGAYVYDNPSGFIPYVGIGIGARYLKISSTINNSFLNFVTPLGSFPATIQQINPYISNLSFAAQLKAGLGYEVADNFYIMLGYRLFWTPRLETSSSQIISDPGTTGVAIFTVPGSSMGSLVTNAVELTLRFAF